MKKDIIFSKRFGEILEKDLFPKDYKIVYKNDNNKVFFYKKEKKAHVFIKEANSLALFYSTNRFSDE